jgi:hypothetical protein
LVLSGVEAVVPSAVSISEDVLSALRTDDDVTDVVDEDSVDGEDEGAVVGDDVTAPAAVMLELDATGVGTGVAGGATVADDASGIGSGGGTGLVVAAGEDGVALVEDVDDDDVLVVDDDVDDVVVDVELVDGGGATGAGAVTGAVDVAGALVELLVLVDAGAVGLLADDVSVSVPVPPTNTTGMVV